MIRNTIPQTPYCPPNRQYVLRCVRMARPLFVRAPHVSLAQGPWGHLLQVPDQGPHLDPPPPRLGPLQTSLALIPGTVTAALSMVLVRSQVNIATPAAMTSPTATTATGALESKSTGGTACSSQDGGPLRHDP